MILKESESGSVRRSIFNKGWLIDVGLVLIGVLVLVTGFVIARDYVTAKVRFKTEATLIDMDITTKKKLKDKDDANYTTNRYKTYYEFRLTWQFVNPNSELKHKLVQTDTNDFKTAHSIGDKKTLYVYYNDDENDFDTFEPFHLIIFIAVGVALPIFAVIDIIGKVKRRKRRNSIDPVHIQNNMNFPS